MSADAAGLRVSLLADPSDAAGWKVYADWLEEHGYDVSARHVREIGRRLGDGHGLLRSLICLRASLKGSGEDHKRFVRNLRTSARSALATHLDALLQAHWSEIVHDERLEAARFDFGIIGWALERFDISAPTWFKDRVEAVFGFAAKPQWQQGVAPSGRADFYGGGKAVLRPEGSLRFPQPLDRTIPIRSRQFGIAAPTAR